MNVFDDILNRCRGLDQRTEDKIFSGDAKYLVFTGTCETEDDLKKIKNPYIGQVVYIFNPEGIYVYSKDGWVLLSRNINV